MVETRWRVCGLTTPEDYSPHFNYFFKSLIILSKLNSKKCILNFLRKFFIFSNGTEHKTRNTTKITYQWFITLHQLHNFNSLFIFIHLKWYFRQSWKIVLLCHGIMCTKQTLHTNNHKSYILIWNKFWRDLLSHLQCQGRADPKTGSIRILLF